MDERDNNSIEPWGDWEYGTGRTTPPKSHKGLIAVLLIMLIVLCGITSVLGVMNVQLFQQLKNDAPDVGELGAIAFAAEEVSTVPTEAATEATGSTEPAKKTEQRTDAVQLNPTDEEDGVMSLQDIYEKNIPSVVSITCTLSGGSASGTGVILSEDGYIVTNEHVIEDAQTISVLLTSGDEMTATVVGVDAISDLAVIHIDASDLTSAEFGDSDSLRVGDTVVAIGDPLGVALRGTMTDGIISAINRDTEVDGRTMTLIQTNAALNSGNSGGPLINLYGQVIGINTMKIGTFTDSAGVEGLGFAIPSKTVKTIVDQLLTYGYVPGRPTLGITGEELTQFYQHFYRVPAGLYITSVDEGSAAAEAGIQAGDILISIDGETVSDTDTLNSIVYSHEVGDKVTLRIYRGGMEGEVTIALDEATG